MIIGIEYYDTDIYIYIYIMIYNTMIYNMIQWCGRVGITVHNSGRLFHIIDTLDNNISNNDVDIAIPDANHGAGIWIPT